jgi:hypothetical protein
MHNVNNKLSVSNKCSFETLEYNQIMKERIKKNMYLQKKKNVGKIDMERETQLEKGTFKHYQ